MMLKKGNSKNVGGNQKICIIQTNDHNRFKKQQYVARYVVLRIPQLVHLCSVNLDRGDTVQVTMPKPYIKYKIISSSRS